MHNYFAKNLKFARESKGLSKSELANKLKVSQSTISRWENEEMGITMENLYDVSNILNIPISDLTSVDISKINNTYDELDVLFSKHKDILTDDDKETIKFLIEKRKREIDKQLGNDNN